MSFNSESKLTKKLECKNDFFLGNGIKCQNFESQIVITPEHALLQQLKSCKK